MIKKKKWAVAFLILAAAFFLMPQCARRAEAASKLRLDRTTIKMAQGKVRQLKVKGKNGRKVTWSSSNEKILTVEKGKITALKGGNAIVTAKVGSKKLRCKVTVVGFNRQKLTLAEGGKFTLKIKNGKNTTWKSTNEDIVKVSQKGVVKAKKTGSATIVCNSNGRTAKCKVYVASLKSESLKLTTESVYHLAVQDVGNTCKWSSSKDSVVKVNKNGDLTAVAPGSAVVTCKSGEAALTCSVTVVNPDNIVTKISALPSASNEDQTTVSINGYPANHSYTIFKQSADANQSTKFAKYMPRHGCAACAAATVLTGFYNSDVTPKKVVQSIEKTVFGKTIWKANYDKYNDTRSEDSSMPMTLYGISKILTYYGIKNEYVRSFTDAAGNVSDAQAAAQITKHLKTGNPVIIEVSTTKRNLNSTKGTTDKTWSNSYHTMVLLGLTDTGKAIVADSANRSGFGDKQRIKYESVADLVPYMFSCTNLTSTSCYWAGKASGGGYILVNP